VGVEGSYNTAKEIFNKIELYVNNELKLSFNSEKTCITNYSVKAFSFLGFNVQAPHFKGSVKPFETIRVNGKLITRRKKLRLSIEMDTKKVIKKLLENGFIRKRTSHAIHSESIYRGRFKGNLINLDHADIIRYYNSVARGIFNYYSFARNRAKLS
jgi:hypothetical protein